MIPRKHIQNMKLCERFITIASGGVSMARVWYQLGQPFYNLKMTDKYFLNFGMYHNIVDLIQCVFLLCKT